MVRMQRMLTISRQKNEHLVEVRRRYAAVGRPAVRVPQLLTGDLSELLTTVQGH